MQAEYDSNSFIEGDANGEIPDKAAALIAAAVRLDHDEDFCEEILKWFEERDGG